MEWRGQEDSISILSSLIKCHLLQLVKDMSVSFWMLGIAHARALMKWAVSLDIGCRRLGIWHGVRAGRKEDMSPQTLAKAFWSWAIVRPFMILGRGPSEQRENTIWLILTPHPTPHPCSGD